ncbi:MAG: Asp-tRNA(Asn)/Glu-tRNA(Gln) amidotransferase subunit GatB, partial [Gammaproteobacteria bacterium]
AKEAVAYMKLIHTLVRYLGICDGNMQEGSFRCDANVSIRPMGQPEFGTRAEIKNLNSFRYVERAINHEVERQKEILLDGGSVVQETRLYDAARDETRAMRSKEEANDYRYFPDPDLLPVAVSEEEIEEARNRLPELPWARRARFTSEYGLSDYDAGVMTASRNMADYYEEVARSTGNAKLSANWIMGELSGALNKGGLDISHCPVSSTELAALLTRIDDNTISGKIAKDVFEAIWAGEGSADDIIEAKGLRQITDVGAIESVIDQVMAENPGQLEQYRGGKPKLFGYFVGQVMKATKGKANPAQVNELLRAKLDN